MIYLGLDYGSRTLGVSISDRTSTIATSLEVIRYTKLEDLLIQLDSIVYTKKVDAFVLGNPLNLDGSISKRTQETLELKKIIEDRYLTLKRYLLRLAKQLRLHSNRKSEQILLTFLLLIICFVNLFEAVWIVGHNAVCSHFEKLLHFLFIVYGPIMDCEVMAVGITD